MLWETNGFKVSRGDKRICPVKAMLYYSFDRTFRWVINLLQAVPAKRKPCMLSDTQQALSLDQKGENSIPFSYTPGESHEERAWLFYLTEIIFILMHIIVRPNKLEINGIETHSVIYLPVWISFHHKQAYTPLPRFLCSLSFKKHGTVFFYCTCQKVSMKTLNLISSLWTGSWVFPHLHRYTKSESINGNFWSVHL